jgi:RNA polymerase sigma-70 factor, ECF subfamily
MSSHTTSTKDAMLAEIPKLRAFAYSLCGHNFADDLVQETLVRAWHHLDRFQEGTNLRAWLFTILRNAYFSELRKKKREVDDADGKLAAARCVAPSQQNHLDVSDLHKALALLPPGQREAILLVAGAGLSYEEVANITKRPIGTIKSRAHRARTKLAQLLGITDEDVFGPDHLTLAIVERRTGTRSLAWL